VGGFDGGDPDDPGFRELVVRWFQFGVFCPILRLHGFRLPTPEDTNRCPVDQLTGGPNEVWSFGPEVYEILKELLFMRERLRPYIAEQMMLAAADGTPIMRPLFWDFPEDRMVYEVEDQFMFGPSLLVAPVVERGAVRRNVYLPAGARWREAHTQTEYEGGRWVTCEAPLRIVPVYLRDDARIPVWEG
jgi:alpha-D-xyloside xylohydrolase